MDFMKSICSPCQMNLIQSEMEKFMRMQDAGLETFYKCPKCRNCNDRLRGAGKEKLTMKAEQDLIRSSVRIDMDQNRAFASLAFIEKPELCLFKGYGSHKY